MINENVYDILFVKVRMTGTFQVAIYPDACKVTATEMMD
jgi:hypothetical protein